MHLPARLGLIVRQAIAFEQRGYHKTKSSPELPESCYISTFRDLALFHGRTISNLSLAKLVKTVKRIPVGGNTDPGDRLLLSTMCFIDYIT